jgi:DNA polymerase-3 subunit alpha
MVALYRPGPMDNIPTYISRKHGEEEVDCLHPLLEPILKETYGVIIYQEQVMQIAQAMAGYSLGEADLLRRAMGKKDKNEMAKQKSRFVEGALKNKVKKADAEYIFELVDKFAGYGFNKSHAAAYALVSYHTAYLKANYREEFLAASMTLDMSNTDKLAMFTAEARKSGIAIEPPCINASEVDFLPAEKRIRYSLAALKGLGAQAVETVVAERAAKGPFADLADFAGRCDPKALNKRALETLAAAGAFDGFERNRALVQGNVDAIMAFANRTAENAAQGTDDLFGGGGGGDIRPRVDMRPVKNWTPMEKLQHEFDAVGFFLSGHPLDAYAGVLGKLGVVTFAELEARADRGATAGRLAGVVVNARERRSQKGNKFAFAMFSEPTGQFEAVIFSETLNASRHLLEPGTAVLINVEGERDGEALKLRAQSIESLDKAAEGVQKGVKVVLDGRSLRGSAGGSANGGPRGGGGPLADLKALLKPNGKGTICLSIALEDKGREAEIALPGFFDISPAQKGAISTVPGVLEVLDV